MSEQTQNPYITLVTAPGIPASERTFLEKHWREAELDPNHVVALNYECRVDLIYTPADCKLLVQAPEIAASEVIRLKSRVVKARKAKRQEDRLIVVNYECRIDAIPA
jgi:hypothetical protein